MRRIFTNGIVLILWLAVAVFIVSAKAQTLFLELLFPDLTDHIYGRAHLLNLLGEHVVLVLLSSAIAISSGLLLGVAVTRKGGTDFLDLARSAVAITQTFPPVAVVALVVPAIGFGLRPAIIALVFYSILPVFTNTVSGIRSIDAGVLESARGMGMSALQVLLKIELPLAANVIFGGIRTSVVINVGTATLGAIVGAGGLGVPIVAGLVRFNPSIVLQGALSAAALALFLNKLLQFIEGVAFRYRTASESTG